MAKGSKCPGIALGSAIVDAVIVGGGIAGWSAALFLAREGRSTIVYDAGRSRIFAVERIREFIGFDGWTPEEMLTKAREEVLRYGAQNPQRDRHENRIAVRWIV